MSLLFMIIVYLIGLGIAIWCTKVIVADCDIKGDDTITTTAKLLLFFIPYGVLYSIQIINLMDTLG